jgi:Asp-tRNA(Asn)/Glu-tRNA(Gln) amidotransferase A subunit family amidase
MEQALGFLRRQGAEIIDPVEIPRFEELTDNLWSDVFRHDVNKYLASLGDAAPYRTIEDIFASGKYAPYIKERLLYSLQVTVSPEEMDPPCLDLFHDPRNIAFRDAVLEQMDQNEIDAIIYPTWSNPPRYIGDTKGPAGDNSQHLAPHTGYPAITVPIGFIDDGLPAGMTFVGRFFSEPDLIGFAYAFEQATRFRRPPPDFPELQDQ